MARDDERERGAPSRERGRAMRVDDVDTPDRREPHPWVPRPVPNLLDKKGGK